MANPVANCPHCGCVITDEHGTWDVCPFCDRSTRTRGVPVTAPVDFNPDDIELEDDDVTAGGIYLG